MQRSKTTMSGMHFKFFLAGQGLLNLGEAVRFIAVTMLIFKLTGSGVSAAAGVVFASLPGIFASPFAGVLGDRTREGRLLITIDIARFFAVPLFLFAENTFQIYLLLVLISLLDVFYIPPRRKFILGSTGAENAVTANSLLTGINGAAYLTGPLLAGILTDSRGPAPALMLSSLCCLFSAFMTLVSILTGGGSRGLAMASMNENGTSAFMSGVKYCLRMPEIVELFITEMIIGFGAISVNLSFYPFAFDVLKVTGKGWSLMITIFYGTNFLAMLMTGILERKYGMKDGRLLYSCLTVVSLIWVLYAFTRNYAFVLLLQFIEGMSVSTAGIILAARLQMITGRQYMARAAGLYEVFSSIGKLAGMGCTALILSGSSFIYVFVSCGILMLVFASINRMRPRERSV